MCTCMYAYILQNFWLNFPIFIKWEMILLEAILAYLSVSWQQLLNASSVFMGIEKLCSRKASYCAGVQDTWATRFCMLVLNICGSSILNLLHVMALRILWQLQDFWKICGLLLLCVCTYPKSPWLYWLHKSCVTGGPPTVVCKHPSPTSQFPLRNRMYWTASHAFKILNLNSVHMMDLTTFEMGATLLFFITGSLQFRQM